MADAVAVTNLSKQYGRHQVFKYLDFQVKQGEIFGILGMNGAGKTTLLECMEGLRDYDSGTVKMNGSIGIQLQSASIPSYMKGKEAVRLIAGWKKTEIQEEILYKLGMEELKEKGYAEMSTGQKRKLHLALALIGDPDILFLDELPEFQRQALEVLRQPLEQGRVFISRAAYAVSYPADFMLLAAMNPCPCGYRTDPRHECTCTAQAVARYRAKLSGPLLDRIDLHVEVPAVSYEDIRSGHSGPGSAEVRERVIRAREVQTARYKGTNCRTNADLSGRMLEEYCRLGSAEHEFLGRAVDALALSARACTRILRVARTIADLDGAADIALAHLAEAISCRVLDRGQV